MYTGDFVNHGSSYDQESLKKVLENAVYGKLGTLGILGNHDYGRNWQENDVADEIVRIAEKAGINVSAVLQAALKKELVHN